MIYNHMLNFKRHKKILQTKNKDKLTMGFVFVLSFDECKFFEDC